MVVSNEQILMVNAKTCETNLTPERECTIGGCDKACKDIFGWNDVGKCTIFSLYCVSTYPY